MRRYATLCLTLATCLAAAIGTAAAAPALAREVESLDFDAWDIDGDGSIGRREFRLGMGTLGVYQRWDSDHDGMLTDEEYRARRPSVIEERDAGFWDAWGLGDEAIEEAEFEGRAYDAYDRDGDERLDAEEWRAFERHAREQGWVPE